MADCAGEEGGVEGAAWCSCAEGWGAEAEGGGMKALQSEWHLLWGMQLGG